MNLYFLNFFHAFAGQSVFLDRLVIFGAEYLIYFLIAEVIIFLLLRRDHLFEKMVVIVGGAALAWGASQTINMLFPVARPFLDLPIQPLFYTVVWISLHQGTALLPLPLRLVSSFTINGSERYFSLARFWSAFLALWLACTGPLISLAELWWGCWS